LKHTVKYKCGTCGEEKETILEGMNSFFGSA
jgi:DNA-directed RNA polymerase subunit RPC12/RpoP